MGGGTVIEMVFEEGGGELWQETAVTLLLCVFLNGLMY
jgi:hypothetical protein